MSVNLGGAILAVPATVHFPNLSNGDPRCGMTQDIH
jgi:hypothetical protein